MASDRSPYREVGLSAFGSVKKRKVNLYPGMCEARKRQLGYGHLFEAKTVWGATEVYSSTLKCIHCKLPKFAVEFQKCRGKVAQ